MKSQKLSPSPVKSDFGFNVSVMDAFHCAGQAGEIKDTYNFLEFPAFFICFPIKPGRVFCSVPNANRL